MEAAPDVRSHWYRPTPDRLIILLLLVECLLWLSNRCAWPAWHKGYAVLVGVAGVGVALAALTLGYFAALVLGWRFQFGIRTLLVLVVAVALPFSWLAVEIKAARAQRSADARGVNTDIDFFGGKGPLTQLFDYQFNGTSTFDPTAKPCAPAWLCRWLRDEFFAESIWREDNGYCSTRLLIDGWSRKHVQSWFGKPRSLLSSGTLFLSSNDAKTYDEAWRYAMMPGIGGMTIYFKQGKVVYAVEEWSDF
jgi:hypothetical protein